MKSAFITSLGLDYPLIVAPMAGGPSSPQLVAAVSEEGALGSIGGAYLSASALNHFIDEVERMTRGVFAINLFLPSVAKPVDPDCVAAAIEQTKAYREELKLPQSTLRPPFEENFEEQFEVVLRRRPRVFSFVFGALDKAHIKQLRAREIAVIGTSTTIEEAQALEESGVDAIVSQGVNAGGHRGLFDESKEDPNVKTLELLAATKAVVKLPIIAAGGLMNAEDIKNALSFGADAVQMGTAFLATEEAGTSDPYRQALLRSPTRDTRLTRAFSGRLARGMRNRFMEEIDAHPESILPYPIQNQFTRDLRKASAQAGSADFLSLWAGTGEGELWTGSAKDLIANLFPGGSAGLT